MTFTFEEEEKNFEFMGRSKIDGRGLPAVEMLLACCLPPATELLTVSLQASSCLAPTMASAEVRICAVLLVAALLLLLCPPITPTISRSLRRTTDEEAEPTEGTGALETSEGTKVVPAAGLPVVCWAEERRRRAPEDITV